jgi:hypothetical protein
VRVQRPAEQVEAIQVLHRTARQIASVIPGANCGSDEHGCFVEVPATTGRVRARCGDWVIKPGSTEPYEVVDETVLAATFELEAATR